MALDVIYSSDAADPGDVGRARRAARHALTRAAVPERAIERCLVIISELVTNAVRHARSSFTVELGVDQDAVRIEVFDRDTRLPVAMATDDDALGGRGLQIVSSLADEWGAGTAERDDVRGKVVWATVGLT